MRLSVAVKVPAAIGPYRLDAVHAEDCAAGLAALPDESVDLVVTSPPYWGQRGGAGLGREPDPRQYIDNLVARLAEAMRCLKRDGTLWLSLGDAYNTPINWRREDRVYSTLGKEQRGLAASNSAYTKNRGRRRAFVDPAVGWLSYGNLLALPWRVVLALCERGFLFRGEVTWVKARPLPEGRCRRPHRRHEGIYILARDERHRFRSRPPVGSVWRLTQSPNLTRHCSTFPVDLPRQCIQAADLAPGSIVLDPFAGSGTTGVAARELGHHFLGFELSREMAALANERLA
jgi:DNA modification methylase